MSESKSDSRIEHPLESSELTRQRFLAIASLSLLGAAAIAMTPSWRGAFTIIVVAACLLAVWAISRPGPGAAVAVVVGAVSGLAMTGLPWQAVMPLALLTFAGIAHFRPQLGGVRQPVGRVPFSSTALAGPLPKPAGRAFSSTAGDWNSGSILRTHSRTRLSTRSDRGPPRGHLGSDARSPASANGWPRSTSPGPHRRRRDHRLPRCLCRKLVREWGDRDPASQLRVRSVARTSPTPQRPNRAERANRAEIESAGRRPVSARPALQAPGSRTFR